MKKIYLNETQIAAYGLIQSDARFFYTLIDIHQNAKNISSNYVMMCQPYIGTFADGAEQWCKKVGLEAPTFNNEEKSYYATLRQGHKLFGMPFSNYMNLLIEKFNESDRFSYSIRSFREKILGYYNVGTDLCNGEFCGNTILGSMYTPIRIFGNQNSSPWLKNISVVAGELAAFFNCTNLPTYIYDDNIPVKYHDYHFYKNCPLTTTTDLGFVLFSVLCSINYVTEFIENYFVEEIPQKFKFAYLQYYYLCDFLRDLNKCNGTNFCLDASMQNRDMRNCLAHYGLGQFLRKDEVVAEDVLKGLTYKAFNTDYTSAKKRLYGYLGNLSEQIKTAILK